MEPTPSGRTIGPRCTALVRGNPYTATDRDTNDRFPVAHVGLMTVKDQSELYQSGVWRKGDRHSLVDTYRETPTISRPAGFEAPRSC